MGLCGGWMAENVWYLKQPVIIIYSVGWMEYSSDAWSHLHKAIRSVMRFN